MKFLEKDLEEIIFEANKVDLANRGLCIWGKLKRQLRIGNYGVADLVSFEREEPLVGDNVVIKIFELKQDKVSVSAFLQAITYLKGIQTYLCHKKYYRILSKSKFEIHLIGASLDTHSSLVYLPDLITGQSLSVHLYTYDYRFDGIHFNYRYNYNLNDPGFRKVKG